MNAYQDHMVVQHPVGAAAQMPMALFDHLGCGLILCSADARLLFINAAARNDLARSPLLHLRDERLEKAPGVSGDLAGAVRLAATRGRRSLVQLHQGDERLLATTVPLDLPGHTGTSVLLILGRRQPCSELALELLASHYGLTLAERRVLAALLRDAKPREIADAHDVKMSTVRTQILSIRSKLGTRSVEGLLLRAAEMPMVAPALRHFS